MRLTQLSGVILVALGAAFATGCGTQATSGSGANPPANCSTGPAAPITLDRAQLEFKKAGYELELEDCDASTSVADLNNQHSALEKTQGHLICSVLAEPSPGSARQPGTVRTVESVESRTTVIRDNVTCTLYTRGEDARSQLEHLLETLRRLD